jgi:hypothetical protein
VLRALRRPPAQRTNDIRCHRVASFGSINIELHKRRHVSLRQPRTGQTGAKRIGLDRSESHHFTANV